MRQPNRRDVLRSAVVGGAGLVILSNSRSAFSYAANEKLNVAVIGCGGRGKNYVDVIPKHANMVAMCDVNGSRSQAAYREHPDGPKFEDFRVMFDKLDKQIDAVTVATPDHTHATASVMAMKRGKHCLCEKGLTRTVQEARIMRQVAVEKKLATQMGNQGSSCSSARRGMEVIQDGVIGNVKEVYSWAAEDGPDHDALPTGEQKVPSYLNWDLWLGSATYRPFHSRWMAWNSWREFGAGRIGMWSSHSTYIAWKGLNMRTLWEGDASQKVRIGVEAQVSRINKISYPKWAAVHYKVPARGNQPPCDWYWIGGLSAPGWREKIEERLGRKLTWDGKNWADQRHSLIVGEKGTVFAEGSNFSFRFLPTDKFKGVDTGNPKRYPRVPDEYNGHEADWLRACRDGQYTVSDFRNSGPYTEFMLLANVASQIPDPFEYDPIEGRITNNEQANALLTGARREGWAL
jgi:predicted dehydrogenase